MANTLPLWADAELSAGLPDVRAKGESETIEFKEQFPQQAHRLSQELAALGTFGGGTLYIGISDNGDLVGIDAVDGDSRDDIVERVHGTISTIKPNLRADIKFAVENGVPVLVVEVPPQDEPIFYYDYRPYIRDGRRSRPANPEEVRERIWAHPSSEFKRRMEDVKARQAETLQQMGQRFAEQSAEQDRIAYEALYGRLRK